MSTHLPVVAGLIARRILVNFRAKPEVITPLLPAPFRPHLVNGYALVGICLIRLEQLRPKGLPAVLGISTENAAHRIAVIWDNAGITKEGVFILRRETNTPAIALAGGRLFPGEHHLADFQTTDNGEHITMDIKTPDHQADVKLTAHAATQVMPGSIFQSMEQASKFFCDGSIGYSPNQRTGELEVMELRTLNWAMQPLTIETAHSSFYADSKRFPAGSIELDSAFIMRGIEHEWHAL